MVISISYAGGKGQIDLEAKAPFCHGVRMYRGRVVELGPATKLITSQHQWTVKGHQNLTATMPEGSWGRLPGKPARGGIADRWPLLPGVLPGSLPAGLW